MLDKIVFGIILTSALNLSAHQIIIENMQFNPPEMSVEMGHKVTWINKDLVAHAIGLDDNKAFSPVIPPGKSWSYKPRKGRKYFYKCSLHPTMAGSFTVK